MKRLIFGLAAIIFAGAMAAFTTPKNGGASFDDGYFAFNYSLYSPTVANVEDESKWIRVLDMNDCSLDDVRACKIRVTQDHYISNTLQPSADIQAAESSTNVAYVVSAEAVQISNEEAP